jgi:hypothetical protein
MESDSFKRFKKDPLFDRLVRRLSKKEFIAQQPGKNQFDSFLIYFVTVYNSPKPSRSILQTANINSTLRLRKIASQMMIEATFKSGYLTKQGGGKGGRKNWKKRWFLLRKDCLEYHDKQQSNEPLGTISLNDFEELEPNADKESQKPHSFALKTSARTYLLVADTAQEKEEWLEWIKAWGIVNKLHYSLLLKPTDSVKANFIKVLVMAAIQVVSLFCIEVAYKSIYQAHTL